MGQAYDGRFLGKTLFYSFQSMLEVRQISLSAPFASRLIFPQVTLSIRVRSLGFWLGREYQFQLLTIYSALKTKVPRVCPIVTGSLQLQGWLLFQFGSIVFGFTSCEFSRLSRKLSYAFERLLYISLSIARCLEQLGYYIVQS